MNTLLGPWCAEAASTISRLVHDMHGNPVTDGARGETGYACIALGMRLRQNCSIGGMRAVRTRRLRRLLVLTTNRLRSCSSGMAECRFLQR